MKEKQEYIKEINLENHPQGIFIEKKIEKSVCKIKTNEGNFGTGFFCLIPFPTKLNLLPVLITNNHILKENDIRKGQKINFSMNNDNFKSQIFIDDLRKTYTSREYDTTIIEIKENDNLDINYFLMIDYEIYKEKVNEKYKEKSIYLLNYQNSQKVIYSLGVIKLISEYNYIINYLCSEKGFTGGPILNLSNLKVIGIDKGVNKEENINVGTLINAPIDEFNQKNQSNKIETYKFKEKYEIGKINFNENNNNEITIIYQNRKIDNINEQLNKEIKKQLGEEVSKNKLFGVKFVKKQ